MRSARISTIGWPASPFARLGCATCSPSPRGTPFAARTWEEAIRRVLADVGGNRRRAAEELGIGLRTPYEKLKRFCIE